MTFDDDRRPSAEQMLARVRADGSKDTSGRGVLKIFFGYAAGVGKTYAMLQEAHRLRESHVDVIIGYVEPHGRPDTHALTEGLESLDPLEVPYRGTILHEFDLDAALVRHPQVIVVDELAHTNTNGSRHAKRWQDIEELLAAGISVLTTCNVQHVESLNDVIAKISGVIVRETVPDDFFNGADELALVDLTPDHLLDRLRNGKVYLPEQAHRALQSFFRKENLVVLRELAMRRAAERVHVDVQNARRMVGAQEVWATGECLLVCLGPSPTSAKVLRAAKRLSNSLRAELVALHIESKAVLALDDQSKASLVANLRLAQRLGAELVTLSGDDFVRETLDFAHRRNVTKIVIGRSPRFIRGWRRVPSLSDRLIQDSEDIDVYVVRGADDPVQQQSRLTTHAAKPNARQWLGMCLTLAVTTGVAFALHVFGISEPNVVMLFLFAVVVSSYWFGRLPSIVASFLAVLLFDVFFTKPYYTIVVHDTQYIVTFVVMLSVALTISALNASVHQQAQASRLREVRTDALYRLGRKLTGIVGSKFLAAESERVVSDVFSCECVVFIPDEGRLIPVLDHPATFAASPSEVAVAQWVLDHGQPAGKGTDTLPSSQALYLPLISPEGSLGVIGVRSDHFEHLLLNDTRSLLEAFASLLALALERDRLTLEAQDASVKAKSEEIRAALLASVSHDIRTPLAVIAGSSSSLIKSCKFKDETAVQRELLTTIFEESDRLTRLVENLLRLTQLTAGNFQIVKEWHPLEDIVGSALHHLRHSLEGRVVRVDLPTVEMLMVSVDAVLLEQVLVNLIENAVRYTPQESQIIINATHDERNVTILVEDRGPGLASHELESVFDAFQRGANARTDIRGAGLGLAICKAIVEAHGGKIHATNGAFGGAVFSIQLPSPAPEVTSVGSSRESLEQ